MLANRTVHCQKPLHSRTTLRLPFGTVRAPSRAHAAVVRSAAVDQPVAEASATEEVAPADAPAPADVTAFAAEVTEAAESSVAAAAATSATNSSRDGRMGVIKVSRNSDVAKSAGYLARVLLDESAGKAVLVRAVGTPAAVTAMRIITRASGLVSSSDSSSIVSFQPQRKRLYKDRIDIDSLSALEFYVVKRAAAELPTDVPEDQHPLIVKQDAEPSAVTSYIMYAARDPARTKQAGPIGHLMIPGHQAARWYAAIGGIIQARRAIVPVGKADLTVTVVKTVEERPAAQQQQQDREAAAAAAEAQADVDDGSSSTAGEADAPRRFRTSYTLKVHVCEPRASAAAGEAGRRTDGTSTSSSSSSRGRDSNSKQQSRAKADRGSQQTRQPASANSTPSRSQSAGVSPQQPGAQGARPLRKTPGMVEVPEDEWLQLKEQLELVPHLTEQLQVMTRQHEQLLSLLAVQQQRDQQEDDENQQGEQ